MFEFLRRFIIPIFRIKTGPVNPGFWAGMEKPLFALAPMEEVTDVVFREMFALHSTHVTRNSSHVTRNNPFVMFTEFINVDGLLHPVGFEKLKIDLEFTENQRPIVVQLWGTNPEKFYKAAQLVAGMGFDGIDINMGCPQDKEIGIGACAALIRNPKLASEIIKATQKGAGSLPVSVKTRIGYTKPETESWIGYLLKHNLPAITLHARTKQEKSKVPAHWEEIKKAVEVRNALQAERADKTLIIGNGDVKTREEGLRRVRETGCDGVMIARGAFGTPWLFRPDGYMPQAEERLKIMLEHAKLFEEKLGGKKSFYIMRKHFKAYATGFEGSSELRAKLLETKNLSEAEEVVRQFGK
ncbi:MAG: tRNA-dihydrouridine synthase [Candidatus Doudnabacteria bacterium]|nr:tRNA-dihydrouridine synthase [Candidatus Doudnabacteria bacterium]